MTVKERLHAIIDELDDHTVAEMLEFVLQQADRAEEPQVQTSSSPGPGVDVDRESLWQVARPVTSDDPLWTIVGLVDDNGPTDMSANKHAYLAKIYGDLHEE
jgi:hypothetical protein